MSTQTKYDLIASLGANCSVAYELKRRFLRSFSLPFDWLLIDDSRTFAYLARAFRNRFDDFMLKENLVELECGDGKYVPYYDKCSGCKFLHFFFNGRIEASPQFYEQGRDIMRRRIDRLYKGLSIGDVCLIIATGVPILNEHLQLLEESLLQVFPKTQFTIRLMRFKSDVDTIDNDGVKVGNCIQRFDYKRKMNDYDFFQTNWEWHFLDSVSVSYRVKITHSLHYRLWRHLDKKS